MGAVVGLLLAVAATMAGAAALCRVPRSSGALGLVALLGAATGRLRDPASIAVVGLLWVAVVLSDLVLPAPGRPWSGPLVGVGTGALAGTSTLGAEGLMAGIVLGALAGSLWSGVRERRGAPRAMLAARGAALTVLVIWMAFRMT